MATDVGNDLLTVAETAELLKVSIVTIHRWLKQGRLPAYHLGPRYVRIRRSDLSKVLTPVAKAEVGEMGQTIPMEMPISFRRLSEEEIRQQLEAMEEAEAFRKRVLEQRHGRPFDPSWPLIRKAREERSERL